MPGGARRIVDERVQWVAEQARVSERTALTYLPERWADQIAADVAVEHEQSQMAERMATGEVEISANRLGALVAGLAVVVQNTVWRAMDNPLPASIGESLDCLTGLALAVQSSLLDVPVTRAEVLAAARLLGSESDAMGRGHATPHDQDAEHLAAVAERLATDAAWERRLAQ